jgi:hypothetical protein
MNICSCHIASCHVILENNADLFFVLQMAVAFLGAISNILAIVALLWPPRKLTSLFHGLVVQLLTVETLSIVMDLLHAFRVLKVDTQCGSYTYCWVAAYILYPLESMLTYASIFITVIIAREQSHALRSHQAYQKKLTERWV